MQQGGLGRAFSDPGNLVLILIGIVTVMLMLHGDTIIKIPRYRVMEVQDTESGVQLFLDEAAGFEKLEDVKLYADPKDNPEWQPPCLPEEAPDYKEKILLKNLEETGVKELVETIEEKFKEATKDVDNPTDDVTN